jgi:hypothetical protein
MEADGQRTGGALFAQLLVWGPERRAPVAEATAHVIGLGVCEILPSWRIAGVTNTNGILLKFVPFPWLHFCIIRDQILPLIARLQNGRAPQWHVHVLGLLARNTHIPRFISYVVRLLQL